MENSAVTPDRRSGQSEGATKIDDLLYDAFFAAAIGGSVLGLFFLLVDLVGGQPFYTPSLIGSVLFLGMAPDAVIDVRLDMVAYVTMLHMGAFGLLGLLLSVLFYEAELHSQHPARVMMLLFVVIEVGFLLSANIFMAGLVAEIGFGRALVGNALTATAMALFMLKSHDPHAWERLIHGRPIKPIH